MISIGEFSKTTSLTVKTLRYYHDLQILAPAKIDSESGYRYYNGESFARAEKIKLLKEYGFTLNEIKNIFEKCTGDEDLADFIRKKRDDIRQKIAEYKKMEQKLNILSSYTGVRQNHFDHIREVQLEDIPILSLRYKGRYADMGEKIGPLYKKAGRWAKGKPFALYHDGEYREDDADIEAALEVKKLKEFPGFTARILKGGKAVCTIYKGPYGEQGQAYLKLFDYCEQKGYRPVYPLEEYFLKGPGMIFPGNPQKYLTEIRIRVT